MEYKRYLITAALPYANGPLHIGHLAGCYLPADIYVRYLRSRDRDVKFICGSDEHGVPITIRAIRENTTSQNVVDLFHSTLKKSFENIDISFDIFSRTTSEIHRKTSQDFFLRLYEKNVFEEKETEQFYDVEKSIYLADRYIIGVCPFCQYDNAYGDQCEKCGNTLSPEQLINPKSALTNSTPIKKKTKHWFFPLNKFESWLRDWILVDKKDKWKINVYNQCKSWLDQGLQPRSITRDSDWGVPVPLEDAIGKVLYVWFEAPIGYISATKELTDNWEKYWKQKDTKLIHFVGKDNIVFHCIIFPAMLKSYGNFILPDNIPANEFLNIEGKKVSTSRNWAVWVDDFIQDFKDSEDVLRFILCSNSPETKDFDFTWKDFQDRNNNELVATFGNFIHRTLILTQKFCNGKVPVFSEDTLSSEDRVIMEEIVNTKKIVESNIELFKFKNALFDIIELSRKGNKFLQDVSPWILAKSINEENNNRVIIDNCLHICLQAIANIAYYINPFLPRTANKLSFLIGTQTTNFQWDYCGKFNLLSSGTLLPTPEILFRKIEDEEIEFQIQKLKGETHVK